MTHPEAVAAPTAGIRARQSWIVALAGLSAGILATILVFWDAIAAAVDVWVNSATYNHCFLILPISLYLIWRRKDALRALEPRPFWPALALFPFVGAVWLVGYFASVLEAQQLAILTLIQVLLLTVLGWRIYLTLLFPFLYLYFMVPTGEFLVPALQDFTAAFTVGVLRMVGIPVFLDGYLISIPTGDFEVAEACAGLRFLIAAVAFGVLFANVMYRSWTRRLAFVALSIVVPIVANGIRAAGIVLIAYFSNNELAVGIDHLVYGWFFFTVVLLLLVWIGARFRQDEAEVRPVAADTQPPSSPKAIAGAAVLAVAATVAAPAAAAALEARPVPARPSLIAAPQPGAPWQAVADSRLTDWTPLYPGADMSVTAHYRAGDAPVSLHIAFFDRQQNRRKLISNAVVLADPEQWTDFWQGGIDGAGADAPERLACQRYMGRGERLVCRWYWVNDRFTASTLEAKLLQTQAELMGGNRSAAAIVLATEVRGDPAVAEENLRRFMESMPSLSPMLRAASGRDERS